MNFKLIIVIISNVNKLVYKLYPPLKLVEIFLDKENQLQL